MTRESNAYSTLGYFNLAKGFGMVLILLGHSITPFYPRPELSESLFSGAGSVLGGGIMAMFFMISGFGFYSRSPKRCLRIQTKTLLLPYCITTAAILITKYLLSLIKNRPFGQNGAELALTYLLGLNAEGGHSLGGIAIESVSIFWFILALFGGWLLYNSIFRIKSAVWRTIWIIICVLLGYFLTVFSRIWPFCLPMVLLSVGYLAAGYEIRQRRLLDEKLPLWFWCCILGITLFCTSFGFVNIVACQWRLGLLDVAGTFCVAFLLMRVYHAFMQRDLRGPLIRMLEEMGFHSFWIVFLHGYEKMILPWYRLRGLFPDTPMVSVGICFLGRAVVIYCMFLVLSRTSRLCRRTKKRTYTIE